MMEHRLAESGIYEIVNLVNGKRYVGSAVDTTRRWQDHRSCLKRGKHHCHILQKAWRKYGEEAFAFRIIEWCDPSALIDCEQAALDRLKPEYNICPLAGSSRGVRHTAEARANMSRAQKFHWSKPEAKAAQLERVRRPENRAKSSLAHRGNTYALGKPRSPEVRAKISAALSGTKHHQTDWALYTIRHVDGAELSGIQMVLREKTGLSGPQMSQLVRGRRPIAKGWCLASP
jgi:group I intron endonuclease